MTTFGLGTESFVVQCAMQMRTNNSLTPTGDSVVVILKKASGDKLDPSQVPRGIPTIVNNKRSREEVEALHEAKKRLAEAKSHWPDGVIPPLLLSIFSTGSGPEAIPVGGIPARAFSPKFPNPSDSTGLEKEKTYLVN